MLRTTNILYLTLGESCFLTTKVFVTFVNNLPQNISKPLYVHCASKNDNLGNHTLATYGESWGFKFCPIPFTTLFYCDLNWGELFMSLHAYDAKWGYSPCDVYIERIECTWKVVSAGVSLPGGKYHPWEAYH
ncbi:plant self-incompatibility protein S1 family [Striga asiatica]|uniref:S-protein homolog n=1 Tax=Striga asiatica TaxID=4170 RepID=A0A5A7QVL9_STRAF|nr:plant self-incompatibility protein S1 family [Striga asiatica]